MDTFNQIIELVGNAGILIFVVASMLGLGLSLTVKQIVDPLRNPRVLVVLLAANFFLVPGLAFLLQRLIPLESGFDIGIILLATAAGAPFLPKLVELAKGAIALSVGAMILLMVVTIVYLPLVLPLLLPGVAVNPLEVALPLVLFMLTPLAVGLFTAARFPDMAQRRQPALSKLSSLGLMVGFVALLIVNANILLDAIGNGAMLAAALLIVGAFLIGWLLAGANRDLRTVLGLATAQRNLSAALLVAGANFSDPNVLVMVMVGAVLMLGGLLTTAKVIGSRVQGIQQIQD
jgi:BASS family bile acid:Na+ symporter